MSSSGDSIVNNGSQIDEETKQTAIRKKDEGNEHFKNGEYEKAIELYSEAIKLNPDEPTFYTNRSIAHFKTEGYGYALEDANKSISLNRNFFKGYYRRAATNMALGKFKEALKDFEILKNSKPGDKFYADKFNDCQKIVRRIAFEKAIAVEEVPISQKIDLDSMVVESSYTGPRIEDGKVTKEFMLETIQTFKNRNLIHKKFAFMIILEAEKLFRSLPTLVEIDIPDKKKFTVIGDIHGQYYDLINIFDLNGLPSEENPYLFNGDFVDRGSFSVECILTLLGFKVLYPNHFHMTRGNHESHTMNTIYGFEGEIRAKYSGLMYDLMSSVFNCLPLCALLNKRVLVMHGGLSKEDITLDDIRKIDRFRDPPNTGIMCDLLWSDPTEISDEWSVSRRGVGIQFGKNITHRFCKKNNLDYIIRSHEVKMNGYEIMHDGKCITIFSAPNYCDSLSNRGAYIIMYGPELKDPECIPFVEVAHPTVKPMAFASPLLTSMM